MPDDDITHPIPDLSAYITEGQIIVSREMHRKAIYPPIDISPSLSRLMNAGIGKDITREDHNQVSSQCYAAYAEGRELRNLVAIVGKDALSDRDMALLDFADNFEDRFVRQSEEENRSIIETLEIAWDLLGKLPENLLTKIDTQTIKKFHPKHRSGNRK